MSALRQRTAVSTIALLAALGLGASPALAQSQPSTAELLQQIKLLEQRLVGRVEILQYRESYGGEVANHDWLAQFIGKGGGVSLVPGHDITIISGAPLSSRHVTEGIKRVLAIHDLLLH